MKETKDKKYFSDKQVEWFKNYLKNKKKESKNNGKDGKG